MISPVSQRLHDAVKLRQSYRAIFGDTDASKRVVRHLMKTCHVTESAFVAGDPTRTAYNNGQRDVVLSILRYVNRTDEDLKKLIEQAYQQENQ